MPSVSAVLAAIKAETQPDLTDGSMRFSDLPTPLLAPQQVSHCKRRPLGREERALQRVKRAAGAPAHHNSNYSIGVARSAHDLVRWEVPGGIRS